MSVQILLGDCVESMKGMADQSVHCCVTSPPYFGLRDYGHAGQIGLEATPDAYVAKLVDVFREVKRVLRDDGTLWLNLGDSYTSTAQGTMNAPSTKIHRGEASMARANFRPITGLKPKDLVGTPWRVAFALQADGWYLRQDIIWHKPNPMPESVRDRCTKAHEYIFLLSKSEKYYFDSEAMKEPADPGNHRDSRGVRRTPDGQSGHKGFVNGRHYETRNKRDVWSIPVRPYKGAHFATFPPALIEPCILAGCPPAGKRCDCDDVISSPTGTVEHSDPTTAVGRAGMSRPRGENEGSRPITKREQRWHAKQMRASGHKAKIAEACGPAFDHYIRTDSSGARPLPEALRIQFMRAGWITESPPCECPAEPAGTVLDPFGGSGTTGMVAKRHGRNAILCELNFDYVALAHKRLEDDKA